MPLVLAIEPDLRQAAIIRRVIHHQVHADLVLVDSRDAAIAALSAGVPDVVLLTALLSPRDEEELITHLRALDGAEHLQTHTIPQLASKGGEARGDGASTGLLARFRKKKETEPMPGCDPDLFAVEVRAFLERAAELKSEAAASPVPTAHGNAHATAPAELTGDGAAPAIDPGSAWSSPFEWRRSEPTQGASEPEVETPRPRREPLVKALPLAVIAEEEERRQDEEKAAEAEGLRAAAAAKRAEAEAKRQRVEAEAARELEQLRLRLEAEARAKAKADEALRRERERLEKEALAERTRAAAAAKAAAEALRVERERLRAEADARTRIEAAKAAAVERERLRLHAESEAKAKAEAAAKARREAEAAAQAMRERLRLEAETAAQAERERLRLRAEAEARAKAEAAAKARVEAAALAAEAAEAAKAAAHAERERLRLHAEAEAIARAEADAKARAEAEARAKAEADAKARVAAKAAATPIVEDAFAEFRDDADAERGVFQLMPLALWARREAPPQPTPEPAADGELHDLLSRFALPPHVAGVTYPRGCRIRRVRVPASSSAARTRATHPIILSKRALEEMRAAR